MAANAPIAGARASVQGVKAPATQNPIVRSRACPGARHGSCRDVLKWTDIRCDGFYDGVSAARRWRPWLPFPCEKLGRCCASPWNAGITIAPREWEIGRAHV